MVSKWTRAERRESKRHEFRIPCSIRATLDNGQPWNEDTWTVDVGTSGAHIVSSIGKVPVGTVTVTLSPPIDLRHVFPFDTVTRKARIVEVEMYSRDLEVAGLHVEFDEPIPVTLM